jgi:hypothetical protein
MPRALVLLILFIAWISAFAEVEKIAILCDKGFPDYLQASATLKR